MHMSRVPTCTCTPCTYLAASTVFAGFIKLDVSIFTSSRCSAAGGFGFCRLIYEHAIRGTQILLRGVNIGRTGGQAPRRYSG